MYTYTVDRYNARSQYPCESITTVNVPGNPGDVKPPFVDNGYELHPGGTVIDDLRGWWPDSTITASVDKHGYGTVTILHRNGNRETWTFEKQS